MRAGNKHVVFDVVGTLVSFSAYFQRIDSVLGPKLRAQGILPKLFGYAWMEAAELEFTFLSISERYKPYRDVFQALFYRMLWMSGIEEPRSFATDEERDQCVRGYSELELRPGSKECIATLRTAGFTVWCFTTGDVGRVRGYFEKGGVDMPVENFVSCDTKGLAKPALAAYRPVFEQFAEEDHKWFAAAHMWDVSAAKKVGFRGAYCTVYCTRKSHAWKFLMLRWTLWRILCLQWQSRWWQLRYRHFYSLSLIAKAFV